MEGGLATLSVHLRAVFWVVVNRIMETNSLEVTEAQVGTGLEDWAVCWEEFSAARTASPKVTTGTATEDHLAKVEPTLARHLRHLTNLLAKTIMLLQHHQTRMVRTINSSKDMEDNRATEATTNNLQASSTTALHHHNTSITNTVGPLSTTRAMAVVRPSRVGPNISRVMAHLGPMDSSPNIPATDSKLDMVGQNLHRRTAALATTTSISTTNTEEHHSSSSITDSPEDNRVLVHQEVNRAMVNLRGTVTAHHQANRATALQLDSKAMALSQGSKAARAAPHSLGGDDKIHSCLSSFQP